MVKSLLTDDELLQAVKQNDRNAFDVLYRKYWDRVYKRAFYYLKDSDACAEIVNDIFLNIWIRRHELHIIKLEGYITSATRYRVYSFLKVRKSTNINYVEDYESLIISNTDDNDGEININKHEIYDKVYYLLNHLPKRCREIFLLSRESHLTNTEIASKLSISKRTVENQISLAVKYLKDHFGMLVILYEIFSSRL